MASLETPSADFSAALRHYREIVDSRMKAFFEDRIRESDGFLKSAYSYLADYVLNGGKRLRPVLAILAYQAAGGRDEDAIALPAVGIELFHNSSLIHDDIMDEDAERRGMLTIHKHFEKRFLEGHKEKRLRGRIFGKLSERFGVSMAILQGNILYALTERCFTESSFGADAVRRALSAVHHTYRVICEGQMGDILSDLRRDVTEEEYLGMIERKTAYLFKTAVEVGAILGGAADRQIDALSRFGFALGTAFQLQDDLIDLDPELKGRAYGSDIRQGKFTLLMIKAFAKADGNGKRRLRSALGNDRADCRTIRAAVGVLRATGAVDDVNALARRKIAESRSELVRAGLADGPRMSFEKLADLLAEREL